MAKIKSGIKVSAPATISNLGSGLDSMALALSGLSDEIVIKQVSEPGVHLQSITGDHKQLPTNLEQNCASLAALKTWEHLKASDLIDPSIGLAIELRKKIPIGSGLGSSAASAVAGAMAVNEFFCRPLEQKALLPFAVEGEKLSCSNPSFASVGAALWGGVDFDARSRNFRHSPLTSFKRHLFSGTLPSQNSFESKCSSRTKGLSS